MRERLYYASHTRNCGLRPLRGNDQRHQYLGRPLRQGEEVAALLTAYHRLREQHHRFLKAPVTPTSEINVLSCADRIVRIPQELAAGRIDPGNRSFSTPDPRCGH